ncbi:putative signal peptide protein [Cryptosporidium canis]|uniref:Signal peptide protein n=1 Tax=Cryptosporidium canis TaxID=195482 RepID=A0ABQ8PCJ8_9CRYT|nr:putative signal peptide protein [Cryptosporidium canis]
MPRCTCRSGWDYESPGPSTGSRRGSFGRRGHKPKNMPKIIDDLMARLDQRSDTPVPLEDLRDPELISTLIKEKKLLVQRFKETIRETKASIGNLLLILFSDCSVILSRHLSGLEKPELEEEIMESLSNYAGDPMLPDEYPIFRSGPDLESRVGVNGMSLLELLNLLESCVALASTIVHNIASISDKKNKIKELRRDLEILTSKS